MKFTDLFIHRPVLATVVSLLVLVLGLRSATSLQVAEYPHTENAIIDVTTVYYGADPDLVASFITTPLENAVAQANGIDYLTSTSQSGTSTIEANLRLNYDVDRAMTEISAKVNSVLNQLPPETQRPVISAQTAAGTDAMYLGFWGDSLPLNKVTDYATRVIQPRLQAVPGVQEVRLLGGKNFAMRAWLDPGKLAAVGLTASDVSAALAANDYISGLGNSKGQMVQVNLTASTSLHTVDEFKRLVIKQAGNTVVRLEDVATVDLGFEDYDTAASFDGTSGNTIAVQTTPSANLFDVTRDVSAQLPELMAQLPQGLHLTVMYDASEYVRNSIHEVIFTLAEALLIVTLVVFAFLGSPRSAMIPVLAIPLTLVGTFTVMLALHFSINLLTLLALVLSIGLVVDDAIIVVENVNRHLEDGLSHLEASLLAARELAGPIVAMTVVLAAVYVPIGFQGGITGALFTEFAFTLVGAVTLSAVIALTLSPMLCSKLLQAHAEVTSTWERRFIAFIDARFEEVRSRYLQMLRESLNTIAVTVVFACVVVTSIYFLYTSAKTELAPQEDEGFMAALLTTAPNSTVQQRDAYFKQSREIILKNPGVAHIMQQDLGNFKFNGIVLKPWSMRKSNSTQVQNQIEEQMRQIAGASAALFQIPPLPVGFGVPIQFVLQSTRGFDQMFPITQAFFEEAQKSGMFVFLDTDLKIDVPQATVEIDRDKAAQLGLKMSDIGAAMSVMLGGGYVNYFSLSGRSYKVTPQVQQRYRLNPQQVLDYHVRAADGTSVPLSTVATITTKTIPESLPRFQQLNAVTIQGVIGPGVSLGDALTYLRDLAARTLPSDFTIDYGGESRQYEHESSGFMLTFGFALVVIFLSLAALFESFRDPAIILVSVPMSIAGALLFITLGVGGATINIYTQVGLVTLMGLISKHGILIVQFANAQQQLGHSKREAVEIAVAVRLRPILMTTAAMVLGVVPLLIASGAGAEARFQMGLVIASGVAIGTLFTLFVVPAAYVILAADHRKKAAIGEAVPI